MAVTRSLGEGVIVKLLKRYAFISDDRLGRIYFPLDAALIAPECSDLRERFKENDEVIFTAQRQTPAHNECNYVASSVVKKNELITVNGIISDISDTFAYGEDRNYGKIFIPFSARNELNRAWVGRGAEIGAACTLKIMRQPEVNHCQYVAFAIYFENRAEEISNALSEVPLQRQCHAKTERQPESVYSQVGVIVSHPESGDAFVFSPQTGLARVPFSVLNAEMNLGSWIKYDVKKYVLADHPKCAWKAVNISPLGQLLKVLTDGRDQKELVVETLAVVCRVGASSRSAWLWNDYIGRIHVSGPCFVSRMKAFSVVRLRAQYTGSFEDVPWCAVEMETMADNAEGLNSCAQLLLTSDQWQVKFVRKQAGGAFYGFLKNECLESKEESDSAFFAWTDMTEGDVPPQVGDMCRATVYKQYRDKKHSWRAVMVTPLDEHGKPQFWHPLIQMPRQIRGLPFRTRSISSETNGVINVVNSANVDTVASPLIPLSCYTNRIPSSEGSESVSDITCDFDGFGSSFLNKSGDLQELSPVAADENDVQNAKSLIYSNAPPVSLRCWDPRGYSINELLCNGQLGNPFEPNRSQDGDLSATFYGADNNIVSTLDTMRASVKPEQRNFRDIFAANHFGSKTVDVATQTDDVMTSEKVLLREILKNQELLFKIAELYPVLLKQIFKVD